MDTGYYIEKGDNVLKSFTFFKEDKIEKALCYYKQALIKFIEKQDFENYAILSEKIGDEYIKVKDTYSALSHYANAQKSYLIISDQYEDLVLKKMMPLWIENGNIQNIGKEYYKLAKINDGDAAISYYEKALSHLTACDSYELKNCLSDFYLHLLNVDNISYALKVLETLIKKKAEDRLLILTTNDHIMLYLLCTITKNDLVLTSKMIDEYCNLVYQFTNSRQHKFVNNINKAYEDNDLDYFQNCVDEYNKLCTLKSHEIKVLLKIKRMIESNNEVDLS